MRESNRKGNDHKLEENKEMVEVNLKRILKKIRPSGKIR